MLPLTPETSYVSPLIGLVRRVSPSDVEEVETKLLEIVRKELDDGFIEGLGRNNLHAYFRSRMHIVSR
jgi:hypothetical protein